METETSKANLEELRCPDWRIFEKEPEKLQFLELWVTKFGFDGSLRTSQLNKLHDSISIKYGCQMIDEWKKVAKAREDGERRTKKERINGASAFFAEGDNENEAFYQNARGRFRGRGRGGFRGR